MEIRKIRSSETLQSKESSARSIIPSKWGSRVSVCTASSGVELHSDIIIVGCAKGIIRDGAKHVDAFARLTQTRSYSRADVPTGSKSILSIFYNSITANSPNFRFSIIYLPEWENRRDPTSGRRSSCKETFHECSKKFSILRDEADPFSLRRRNWLKVLLRVRLPNSQFLFVSKKRREKFGFVFIGALFLKQQIQIP